MVIILLFIFNNMSHFKIYTAKSYSTSDHIYNFNVNDLETDIIKVTDNPDNDFEPCIFMVEDQVWVIWSSVNESNGEIWATYTTSPYKDWQVPFRISDDLSDDWNPSGVVDNYGVIWVFWESNRLGDYNIWYKNSTNNGYTWSPAFQLTNNSSSEKNVEVLVDSINELCVFYNTDRMGINDIVIKKSINNRSSWEQEQIVSISNVSVLEEISDVCIGQNEEILLFVQERESRFAPFIWTSLDLGLSWQKYQVTPYENNAWGTVFTTSTNEIYVVYERNSILYLRSSKSFEEDWSPEKAITSFSFNSQHPDCYIDENDSVHFIWTAYQENNDWDIYYKKFDFSKQDSFFIDWISDLSRVNQDLIVSSIMIATFSIAIVIVFANVIIIRRKAKESRIQNDLILRDVVTGFIIPIIVNVLYPPKFRKIDISDIENNEIRVKILSLLEEVDFMHFREIKRRINSGIATLRWHLQVLEDFGLVKHKRSGQYLIYFLSEKPPNELYLITYFALINKRTYEIASIVIKQEYWTFDTLTNGFSESKKKIGYHCKKLIKKGIIKKDSNDIYTVVPVYREWILKVLEMNDIKN